MRTPYYVGGQNVIHVARAFAPYSRGIQLLWLHGLRRYRQRLYNLPRFVKEFDISFRMCQTLLIRLSIVL